MNNRTPEEQRQTAIMLDTMMNTTIREFRELFNHAVRWNGQMNVMFYVIECILSKHEFNDYGFYMWLARDLNAPNDPKIKSQTDFYRKLVLHMTKELARCDSRFDYDTRIATMQRWSRREFTYHEAFWVYFLMSEFAIQDKAYAEMMNDWYTNTSNDYLPLELNCPAELTISGVIKLKVIELQTFCKRFD